MKKNSEFSRGGFNNNVGAMPDLPLKLAVQEPEEQAFYTCPLSRRGINSPAHSESPLKWTDSCLKVLFRGLVLLAWDFNLRQTRALVQDISSREFRSQDCGV